MLVWVELGRLAVTCKADCLRQRSSLSNHLEATKGTRTTLLGGIVSISRAYRRRNGTLTLQNERIALETASYIPVDISTFISKHQGKSIYGVSHETTGMLV